MLYRLKKRETRRIVLPMLVLLLSLGVMVACTQNAVNNSSTATLKRQSSSTAVTITAMDSSYDLPQSVSAGLVDITLVNSGSELHQAGLVRLNTGVTFEQFQAMLKQKGLLVMRQLGTLMGGPNITAPGKSSEVILDLPAGQYVVLSAVLSKNGVRQYLEGLITSLTVTGSSNTDQVQAPSATGEAVLKSFSIQLPASIASGPINWKVTNSGQEPYEMNVLKLAPGKTAQDAVAFYTQPSGPPPFANLGGMSAISPGRSGWVKLNLAAGNYVALSLVFDRATGKAQYLLGMITSFSVQ